MKSRPAYLHIEPDNVRAMDEVLAEEAAARERFRVLGPVEWSCPAPPMSWDVRGVWPEGSFGPLGGEKKTLKTYTAMAVGLALASGRPAFGYDAFSVPRARPVIYFSGEGGVRLATSRLQRIAAAYGVDEMRDLPFYLVCDSAPLDSAEFLDPLRRAMDEYQPGMVIVDPLYAFHPSGIEAGNLYERGRMLSGLSGQTVSHGTSLLLPDHFRKNGSQSLDLDSIAQSGVGAWADSWVLQAHRSAAKVHEGEFRLAVEFGSRHGYGRRWDIDWNVGAFDYDTGQHTGDISWEVAPHEDGPNDRSAQDQSKTEAAILQVLADCPWELTMTAVADKVGGNTAKVRDTINGLIALGIIGKRPLAVPEGRKGVPRTRERLGLVGDGKVRAGDSTGSEPRNGLKHSGPTRSQPVPDPEWVEP